MGERVDVLAVIREDALLVESLQEMLVPGCELRVVHSVGAALLAIEFRTPDVVFAELEMAGSEKLLTFISLEFPAVLCALWSPSRPSTLAPVVESNVPHIVRDADLVSFVRNVDWLKTTHHPEPAPTSRRPNRVVH
jgi:hypothetical protein